MYLPFPNIDNRSLSLREQLIERLIQLDRALVGEPDHMIDLQRRYLRSLKDFALLQSLEVMVSGITYDNVESMSRLCGDAAYNDGKAVGYERGHDEGHEKGYEQGFADGYEEGYWEHLNPCHDDRDEYSEAFRNGKAKGYEIGYDEGYVDGKQDGIYYGESGQAELDREADEDCNCD